MSETMAQMALEQVGRPLTLLPVGLKEAALDSPSFRATAVHFSDQVEIVERWLDGYVKSTSKLIHDTAALEETINTFLGRSLPPINVSEAVLDHDYTLLAMQRFGEGSRDWWSQFIGGSKKMETTLVEPLKAFMNGELRNFKDARRYLEQTQKLFDGTLARYLGQSKTKEPSSLREDAFQVHETRKAYLKASLDFCLLAPQLRFTLDKLLVKISTDQWKEMKKSREVSGVNAAKWNGEMERIRGWSREMDTGESVFRRELQAARKEIAQAASTAAQPSRELEDYNISTVPYLGVKGPSLLNLQSSTASEKQDWLFLRTISGKPARTTWARRWCYVKNGIFGWLVQGSQSGGVEESEKIGVLLCNVKPAVTEDRRFCFEVKTKNATILLQAETQSQLLEWLEVFEIAKNNAIKASASDDFSLRGDLDPAFAITPPSIPEFAAKREGHVSTGSDDFIPAVIDRGNTLPIPGFELGSTVSRSSIDVTGPARRSITSREEGESGRDHAARIIQKLDLHRRSTVGWQDNMPPPASPAPTYGGMGGIGSLISASHNILPVYVTPALTQAGTLKALPPPSQFHTNTLAPSTLVNPPAPTNLSKAAVIVSAERGIGIGRSDATGGMPSGLMANLWGSANWGYVNRLGQDNADGGNTMVTGLVPQYPPFKLTAVDENLKADESLLPSTVSTSIALRPKVQPASSHRKAISVDALSVPQLQLPKADEYPSNYPLELKTQDAQFHILFADVPKEERVVLVFRATFNPNDQQEFPGRVYVTQKDVYFYSHHLGLVLITSASLDAIDEVTAAPGKNCDFLFLHLKESVITSNFGRITVKTFLEPLRLLQSRLNYLVESRQQRSNKTLEEIMTDLIDLETEAPPSSPSNESWGDVSMGTPYDSAFGDRKDSRRDRDLKRAIHIEKGLVLGQQGKLAAKIQLPLHPIVYVPEGMDRKPVERVFDISPKSLFHVMFGDKSAVFQLLYHERRAQRIAQGPWVHLDHGHMQRDFSFQIDYVDMFRRHRQANIVDYQVIDILNDHVCYVVTDKKTPWHLPHYEDFKLVTKIVITHVAKSKCKLALYNKVEWSNAPAFSKGLVERQALDDLDLDALDLTEVVAGQVRKLGFQSRTKKAIQIFGHVGHKTSVSLFANADGVKSQRQQIKQRTLGTMVWERTSSFLETALSMVMMWTFALLKKIWSISSANSIILSLLFLSVLMNMFMSGKDASEWWRERDAAKFLSRLGVGPNLMMSKAVYVKDLNDALTVSVMAGHLGDDDNQCYQTFQSMANTTDMDAPYQDAGGAYFDKSTKSTARRLRRTRQHLGVYRHDLLVAMRVVNNVEREMLRAEWENWLQDEIARCAQVKHMLLQTPEGGTAQQVVAGPGGERLEGLRRWQEVYCGSCRREQDRLFGGEGQESVV